MAFTLIISWSEGVGYYEKKNLMAITQGTRIMYMAYGEWELMSTIFKIFDNFLFWGWGGGYPMDQVQ